MKPKNIGLYSSEFEHDACGVGLIANIHGAKSHAIVENALLILKNLMHRGGEGADSRTGDGAGILVQIPHEFILLQGIPVPERGKYGTGIFFLPKAEAARSRALAIVRAQVAAAGEMSLLAVRDVPVNSDVLGSAAREVEPAICQIFVTDDRVEGGEFDVAQTDFSRGDDEFFFEERRRVPAHGGFGGNVNRGFAPPEATFEQRLYLLRKAIERAWAGDELARDAYCVSLSSQTLIYKGMLTSAQLREYYADLRHPNFTSGIALVHSRFSTNTFPEWRLAQPFRMLAHNGEINTIRGNRTWMAARESLLDSPALGPAEKLVPILQPGMSDSASLDNALEFFVQAGKTLPHALAMLIPESWNDTNPISADLKAFYEYHSIFMEPWDGPAAILFSDGRLAGGMLDRNGLRPARWLITTDGTIVIASETGTLPVPAQKVRARGRLHPGKMLLVDTAKGKIFFDTELKEELARAFPYANWLAKNRANLADLASGREVAYSVENYAALLRVFGYTTEDLNELILPMATKASEPVGSMGNDTPPAVFSTRPQRLFSYFRQLFAQVTNPPIDPIREELVMALTGYIGSLHRNVLTPVPEICKVIKIKKPILTNRALDLISHLAYKGFRAVSLPAVFTVPAKAADEAAAAKQKATALADALDGLCRRAEAAVDAGASFIILSDRATDAAHAPIPSLLAVSAVHRHLIAVRKRFQIDLVVESAEPRETMHFALLFGYGANAVNPYLVFAILDDKVKSGELAIDMHTAETNYINAISKGLLKILSKMGIATMRSYRSSGLFEAVGISEEVIEKYFHGTVSKIGGIGLGEIAEEALAPHRAVFASPTSPAEAENSAAGTTPNSAAGTTPTASAAPAAGTPKPAAAVPAVAPKIAGKTAPAASAPADAGLENPGFYHFRKGGEFHAWQPAWISMLRAAARKNDAAKYAEFAKIINEKPEKVFLRDFLDYRRGNAVPLERVEPAESIMHRFVSGAMSFGSISKEAHETIAVAMNSIGSRSNCGEGGEDPERFRPRPDGTSARSAIKQVASGRFGVTTEYLVNADELQIKIAQGAKPGEGGQLLGFKVNDIIAKTRHSLPGITLISPPPHHDIYSIEDLAQLIFDLKNVNPHAAITVKLVSETGVGTVAAGVAKAHADGITISGAEGGTGASPISSVKWTGLPLEIGLAETHQTLVLNRLRQKVVLTADGQLKTGRDVVLTALLGAEEFGFATALLIIVGCIQCRSCHTNKCPVGIATQSEALRKKFSGKPEFIVNYLRFVAEEVRSILAEMGFEKFEDIVGRADLLVSVPAKNLPKTANLDFSRLLWFDAGTPSEALHKSVPQHHDIDDVMDKKLIAAAVGLGAGTNGDTLEMTFKVRNTDRAVGAMLSGEIAKRFGNAGLPEDSLKFTFRGSAGQSFGAFLAHGISFRLEGDANDYLGKGLSGGKIALVPAADSRADYIPERNIIAGNTLLYGATSGEVFINGRVGERFCVRNSGATAVVEGVGDHACEYMTGGRVLVLGSTGRNFAAGMSGGIAYVFNVDDDFDYFCNMGMVELSLLETEDDEREVRELLEKHVEATGSPLARRLLFSWHDARTRFIKVLPIEYKKRLLQLKA